MTQGMAGSLKIPLSWINEAKVIWRSVHFSGVHANNKIQAIYVLNRGDVFEAYHLYLQAGMHGAAHELAVFELAPEAVIRNDLELLQVLFERFVGHAVNGWHVRGKVCKKFARAPLTYNPI
jgi:nuclear pore complex protein Nup98-Nup96